MASYTFWANMSVCELRRGSMSPMKSFIILFRPVVILLSELTCAVSYLSLLFLFLHIQYNVLLTSQKESRYEYAFLGIVPNYQYIAVGTSEPCSSLFIVYCIFLLDSIYFLVDTTLEIR